MTVRQFLTRTMSMIGVIASGDAMSASEAADGLLVLNDVLDSWSADGDLRSKKIATNVPFTAALASYSIAQSAKLVDYATMKLVGSTIETEIKILTLKEWALIPDKTATGVTDSVFIDDTGNGMVVKPFPIPSAAMSINLYRGGVLSPYTSMNDEMTLSPGYSRALKYEIGIELAQEYGKTLKPSVFATAADLKAAIKRANYQPATMTSDAFGMSSHGQNKSYDNTIGE